MKYISLALLGCALWACQNNNPPNADAMRGNTELTINTVVSADNYDSIAKENLKQQVADAVAIDSTIPEDKKQQIVEKITKEYLMGKFDPAKDTRFEAIPTEYKNKEETIYMRKEALESYKKMYADAKKAGIALKIVSACRPFNVQKAIWESKWQGKRQVGGQYVPQDLADKDKALMILRWNSMPSTSRHHWGTDVDINAVNPEYFDKSPGKEEYAWLVTNAPNYGFCQVYSPKGADRPDGYEEEKWHWSYLPVAKELIKEYEQNVSDSDISGFIGSNSAKDIEVVRKYVLGINPKCKF